MGGHAFISHSHADRPYVEKLARHFQGVGVPVWFGEALASGPPPDVVVQRQLDACGAVVVVLSPDSVDSAPVGREIAYAQYRGKPVLPLMVRPCHPPIALIMTQYEDVTPGRLPGGRFMDALYAFTTGDGAGPGTPPIATTRIYQPARPASGRAHWRGTVAWFYPDQGYGFITVDGGNRDVVVRQSAVDALGAATLRAGDRVEFEIIQGERGPQADQVRVVRR